MFREQYKAEIDRIEIDAETKENVLSALKGKNKKVKPFTVYRRIAACAACLVVIVAVVLGAPTLLSSPSTEADQTAPLTTDGTALIAENASVSSSSASPANYSAVYETVYAIYEENKPSFWEEAETFFSNLLPGAKSENASDGAVSSSAAIAEIADEELGVDYSTTNVQTEGIDEGDCVKTDGDYIYFLKSSGTLSILKADGENTFELSCTQLIEEDPAEENIYKTAYAEDIYIDGDTLLAICQYIEYDENYFSVAKTCVKFYDISDRSSPVMTKEFLQDGFYHSSRLKDGVLYLISQYDEIIDEKPEEDDPSTYVPCYYESSTSEGCAIPASCIEILPNVESVSYTVISAVSASDGGMLSNVSLLGDCNGIYMSEENLYLYQGDYEEELLSTYTTDDGLEAEEYSGSTTTWIRRYSFEEGDLQFRAEGMIEGYLNNSFSLDEYDGYLRVVSTTNDRVYTTFRNNEERWISYQPDQERSSQTNQLVILDMDLQKVGKISDLAPDETIYSARFDGEVGYFVTFRQVDPLFAVDLSDPANPVITGELKIPGFSEYLHFYEDGLLLGIGLDADPETGATGNMKLSMFNISDPFDVTEQHCELLDTYYSEALYNHKAILVSAEKDLIAFPYETGYLVYGYDKDTGFYLRNELSLNIDWYSGNIRGLYIGDYFYVVSDEQIFVFELKDFSLLASIAY